MNKLLDLIQEVMKKGPMIDVRISPLGRRWQATLTTDYTDLYKIEWFDEEKPVPPLTNLFIMREYGDTPQKAIKNARKRFAKIAKKMKHPDDLWEEK